MLLIKDLYTARNTIHKCDDNQFLMTRRRLENDFNMNRKSLAYVKNYDLRNIRKGSQVRVPLSHKQ